MLTLANILAPETLDQKRAKRFLALQGISPTLQSGIGLGKITASGYPLDTYDIIIQVTSSGVVGGGQIRVSTDGGTTWGLPVTIPGSGNLVLTGTGLTLNFVNADAAATYSFFASDTYEIAASPNVFPVTSWAPGSVPRSLLEADALVDGEFERTLIAIASGGLLLEASGDWLTLLALNVYDLEKKRASLTRGVVRLTDTASSGPFDVAVGQVWVVSDNGLRFVNIAGGTVPLNGHVDLVFQAEAAGGAYNVGVNGINNLVTSLPGITVSNPIYLNGTWVTQNGTDAELDSALQTRCLARWPSLSQAASPLAVYQLWATTASASVTRAYAQTSSSEPGEVDVYLAGPSGPVGDGDVSTVDAYIQERIPLTSTAVVQSSSSVVINITGTVYFQGDEPTARGAVETNLNLYSTLVPIGNGTDSYVVLAEIYDAIMNANNILNFIPTSPTSDQLLSIGQVASFTFGLTYTLVS